MKAISINPIKLISILLFVRVFADLPNSLAKIGLTSHEIPLPFTKLFSFLIIFVCLVYIPLITNKLENFTINNLYIISLFFILEVANGIFTFSSYSMPIDGVFVVFSRFLVEIIISIYILSFYHTKVNSFYFFKYFYQPTFFVFFLYGFYQIFTNSYVNIQGIYRLNGPFNNPNTFAGLLNLLVVFSVYFREAGFLSVKRFNFIVFSIIFLLLYTGSLTSIIGFLFFFIIKFFLNREFLKKRFLYLFPIGILSIIYLIIIYWDSLLTRVSIVINPNTLNLSSASSISWRISAWKHYLSLSHDFCRIIFGHGLGFHRFIFLNNYKNNLSYIFQAPGTHNDFLAVFIDFGLIGFVVLIYFIYIIFRLIYKSSMHKLIKHILYASVFDVLLIMVMDNYIDGLFMWIYIAFLLVVIPNKFPHDHSFI